MKLGFPSPEFDDAVAAVCHGSATEAEMQALNELLRSDSRARDEYLMQVELHARLASNPEFFACAAVGNTAFPEPEIQPNLEHKDAIPNNLTTLPSRRIVAKALALAACIGLLAAEDPRRQACPALSWPTGPTPAVPSITASTSRPWGPIPNSATSLTATKATPRLQVCRPARPSASKSPPATRPAKAYPAKPKKSLFRKFI